MARARAEQETDITSSKEYSLALSLCYRLPPGGSEAARGSKKTIKLSFSPECDRAAARRSSECVTEGERGTSESAITTLAEAELSQAPSTTKGGPPPSRREARSPHGSGTLWSPHPPQAVPLPHLGKAYSLPFGRFATPLGKAYLLPFRRFATSQREAGARASLSARRWVGVMRWEIDRCGGGGGLHI